MTRGYNFGAGPAMLPQEILMQAQEELLEWQNQGMSVVEMSHRSQQFQAMMQQAEQDLRDLLDIPSNYHVLFINGAARLQFAMLPMNLLSNGQVADYVVTGTWSKMAFEEAQKLGRVNLVASGDASHYLSVPDLSTWKHSKEAAYCYYTPNETITGVAIDWIPETGDVPLVADMTSCLLSKPIDVSKYGVIFAGSQKNIAPAGLTIVIIRDDLLNRQKQPLPSMLDYGVHVKNQSLYATPASFNCYMAGLMFQWLKKQGGLNEMATRNQRKAQKLYEFIDASEFFHCPIPKSDRSIMNIAFVLKDNSLDELFLTESKDNNLLALKGHRSVGGMRASIYNAMPESGVDSLIAFMQSFEKKQS